MDDIWAWLLGNKNAEVEGGDTSFDFQYLPLDSKPSDNPLWFILFVLVIAAIFVAVFFYKREKREMPAGIRFTMAGLRALLLLFVIFVLLGPKVVVTIQTKKPFTAIVLIDNSGSMGLSEKIKSKSEKDAIAAACGISPEEVDTMPRIELVKKAIAKQRILEDIAKMLDLSVYTFTSNIKQIKPSELQGVTATGNLTAIGDAIEEAIRAKGARNVEVVIIFSDGINNAGSADPIDVARKRKNEAIKIISIAPYSTQPSFDVALRDPEAPDFVYARDYARVNFQVSHRGFDNQPLTVSMYEKEIRGENKGSVAKTLVQSPKAIEERIKGLTPVATKTVTLPAAGANQDSIDIRESLDYAPEKPGLYEIIIKAEIKPDDSNEKNNYITHVIRVVDNKMKVLYVDRYRQEYYYLEKALIRDPSIQCHCWQVDADINFPQECSRELEPLKELPSRLEDLIKYDAIILGDIGTSGDSARGVTPEFLESVRKFVDEFWGGVVLLAGYESPESFMDTPVGALLPVRPYGRESPVTLPAYDKEILLTLTPSGINHPITQLISNTQENIELWESRIGTLFWYKPVRNLKPGAVSIVNGKSAAGDIPIVCYQMYGSGRVVMILTDEIWRFRKFRGDSPYYYPFWKQTLKWVREEKLHGSKRYFIKVDKARYDVREKVNVTARAYDLSFKPLNVDSIEATLTPPIKEEGVPQKDIKVKLSKFQGMEGRFEGSITISQLGLERVDGEYFITVGDELNENDMATDSFEVYIPDREIEEVAINTRALQAMATETGGVFLTLSQGGEIKERITQKTVPEKKVKDNPLWDTPLIFIVFAILITIEWVLRKLFRLM